tara:strand:+ start:310 stop:657 length:348 start_codon:yes stop_codon:yes gene_type:complete
MTKIEPTFNEEPVRMPVAEERQMIIEQLLEGVLQVTFTKKNGEERIMDCTLNMDIIPEAAHPKSKQSKQGVSYVDDEGVQRTIQSIACYDVKAEGWRSFLVPNVTHLKSLTTEDI